MKTVQFRLMEMIDGSFRIVELYKESGKIVDYVEDLSDCLEDDSLFGLVRELKALSEATQLSVVREIDVIKSIEEHLKISVDSGVE